MKCYIVLLLLVTPFITSAQTNARVDKQMRQFVNFYNKKHTDNICSLFPKEQIEEYDCFWKWAEHKLDAYSEYGKIKSFVYAGVDTSDPEGISVFKVVYEKAGTKAMSFTLGEENKFGTFRFDTSSDEIEEMIRNVK